ncbi:MAG: S8 family serine peptidase, partial [Actinomycetota bacterium]|nr:S8 family serine peptidase [Actinomycetota bacterium]
PSPCTPALQAAVLAATAKGMILVAAAGNDANVTNASQNPANCIGVIAVGAYDQNIRAWDGSQRQPYVSLAGPGVHMIDAYPSIASGYGYGTGTSDAAAIVSGTLAVVRSKFPTLSSRDIVTRVLATARQFQGAPGTHNNTWGYGAARPRHALTDTVPANAPNPVYDALAKLSGASKAPPSSGASGSSETPTAGPSGPQTIAAPPGGTATSSRGSSNVGLVVGIVVAVLVLLAVVLFVVLRGRRRTGGHGPTGPSGPWNGPPRGPGPGSW